MAVKAVAVLSVCGVNPISGQLCVRVMAGSWWQRVSVCIRVLCMTAVLAFSDWLNIRQRRQFTVRDGVDDKFVFVIFLRFRLFCWVSDIEVGESFLFLPCVLLKYRSGLVYLAAV